MEGQPGADALIQALEAREPMVRAAAAQTLRKVSDQAFGFEAEGPASKRRAAVKRWQEWWAGRQAEDRSTDVAVGLTV